MDTKLGLYIEQIYIYIYIYKTVYAPFLEGYLQLMKPQSSLSYMH
jgi:hypothetical protein